MDILLILNRVIEYVEKNLTSNVDYNEAAKICCCSSYNFHRMFSFLTGISITEYVRNRRMTLAAFELQNYDKKIIDIALKYGYNSPVSFARAFRLVHNISPSQIKKGNLNIKAFPRMSFQIQIKGASEMNYRIEEKCEFKAFGVETEYLHNSDKMQIPNFFTQCINDGTFDTIAKLGKEKYPYTNQPSMSGISNYKRNTKNSSAYMMGWLVFNNTPLPKEYTNISIPSSKWAIFETERYKDNSVDDVNIIQSLWKRIFQEWLPSSEFELDDLPQIEQDFYNNPDSCYVEIWIPLKKK